MNLPFEGSQSVPSFCFGTVLLPPCFSLASVSSFLHLHPSVNIRNKRHMTGSYVKKHHNCVLNSAELMPSFLFLPADPQILHTPYFCSFLFSLPSHLSLDGQWPLPQPPQEMQRGQHGAQLAEISQLELISECGGRDARQWAETGQGARCQRRVRDLSRHHVRLGHHRRCGERERETEKRKRRNH